MNILFEPRNMIPIERVKTVYPILRITDNWGILTVKMKRFWLPIGVAYV